MADMNDPQGAFTSRPDFDLSAFYAHVGDTWANPHPQYRWATTPIVTGDILNGTILAEDLNAAVTAKFCITGEIKMWLASAIPAAHLLLDGSAVSRTTYADLFALWGTNYGVGDGATTFNLPDFQLRIPIGLGVANVAYDTLGKLAGAFTHTMDVTEVVAHTHGMQSHTHAIDHGHGHSLSMGNHTHDLGSHTHGIGGGLFFWVATGGETQSGTGNSASNNTYTATDGPSTNTSGNNSSSTINGGVTSVVGNSGAPSNNTTTSVGTTTPFSIANPTIVVHFIVKT